MPLQNDKLPSKHLQDGLALWFFFSPSNMQLKTLDSSKLLGFLTPIMWFLPKNTDTHREQHDHLLICFLMVLSLETEKMQRTLLWFYSLQVGFLVRFGFTTKWASWNWSRKAVLDFSNCSGPLGASFLSTNWVLNDGWKQLSKTILMKKTKFNPVLTPFRHSFGSEEAYPRPGTL